MANFSNKNNHMNIQDALNIMSEVLSAGEEIRDTEVKVNVDKKSVKELGQVKDVITDTSSAMANLSNSSDKAANSVTEAAKKMSKATQRTGQQTDKSFKKLENIVTRYRNIAKVFGETEHKIKSMSGSAQLLSVFSGSIDKRVEKKANKATEDLCRHIESYKARIETIHKSASEYEVKGKHASSLYNDKNLKALFNEKEASDSANRYINALKNNGKVVNKAIIEQIKDREKLYHAYKTLESSVDFNNSDFTDRKKNEKTVETLSEMVKIAKQIEYIDSKTGMSNSEHMINVSEIESIVSNIVKNINGKNGISQAFRKEFESTKNIMDAFFEYLREGDKNGFEKSVSTKFFEDVRNASKETAKSVKKDMKSTLDEYRKVDRYISDKTKLEGKAKYAWDKLNRSDSKSKGSGLSELGKYEFVGQIANAERNGTKFNTTKNAYKYLEQLLKESTELKNLYDSIVKYQPSTATSALPTTNTIADTQKIKEITEAQKKYNKQLERAKQLGVDTSSFVSVDGNDVEAINASAKALKGLADAAERAGKVSVAGESGNFVNPTIPKEKTQVEELTEVQKLNNKSLEERIQVLKEMKQAASEWNKIDATYAEIPGGWLDSKQADKMFDLEKKFNPYKITVKYNDGSEGKFDTAWGTDGYDWASANEQFRKQIDLRKKIVDIIFEEVQAQEKLNQSYKEQQLNNKDNSGMSYDEKLDRVKELISYVKTLIQFESLDLRVYEGDDLSSKEEAEYDRLQNKLLETESIVDDFREDYKGLKLELKDGTIINVTAESLKKLASVNPSNIKNITMEYTDLQSAIVKVNNALDTFDGGFMAGYYAKDGDWSNMLDELSSKTIEEFRTTFNMSEEEAIGFFNKVKLLNDNLWTNDGMTSDNSVINVLNEVAEVTQNKYKELATIVTTSFEQAEQAAKDSGKILSDYLDDIETWKKHANEVIQAPVHLQKANQTEVLSGTTPAVRAQKEIKEELKDTRAEAEKTAEAISNIGKGKPGNPEQILYHNSDSVFDSFDMSKAGEHGGLLGNGAYFSLTNSDTYSRADFGKYQTQWIANVQNIFDTFVGFSDEEIERIMQQYFSDKSEQIQKELRSALKSINVNAKPSIGTIQELGGIDFGKIVQSLGYDATLREDELAVYDSSKIQRANTSVYNNELREYIDLTKEATSATKELNDVQQGNQTPLSSPENPIKQKAQKNIQETVDYINRLKKCIADNPNSILDSIVLGKDGGVKTKAEFKEEVEQLIKRTKDKISAAFERNNFESISEKQYNNIFKDLFRYMSAGDKLGLLNTWELFEDESLGIYHWKDSYHSFRDNTNPRSWAESLNELAYDDYSAYVHLIENQEKLDALQKNNGQDYIALLTEEKDLLQQISDIKSRNANAGNIDAHTLDMDVEEAKQRADALEKESELIDRLIERHKALYNHENAEYLNSNSGSIWELRNLEELQSKLDNDAIAYKRFKEVQAWDQQSIFEKATDKSLTRDIPKELERYWEKLENAILDSGMSGKEAIEKFNEKAKELGKTFDETQKKWVNIKATTLPLNQESSGQLALQIDGVKEASFEVKNAQDEIQKEVTETNQVIKGQIDLFDYLKEAQVNDKLKPLESSVKNQEKWIKSLKDYAGGLSIDEKMPKKEAWDNLQRAAKRYYDVVNNPKNQFDAMALEKATLLYANAYEQAKTSKVADSRLNQYTELLPSEVAAAQSSIDKEFEYRQAVLNNALIDIIDIKKQIGEDYSKEESQLKILTNAYIELHDAAIKYENTYREARANERNSDSKIEEITGKWDKYNIGIGGYNRYINTYADVNRDGGKYSDMSAKQIIDYLNNEYYYGKSYNDIGNSDYGKLAAYAVRLEEKGKNYKEIFKNAGFDEKFINDKYFEEAISQMRQLAPLFEKLRQGMLAFGEAKTDFDKILIKNNLFSGSWAKHGLMRVGDITNHFIDGLGEGFGFSEKDFDKYIKDIGLKKFEDYYQDIDGQLSFTPLKQDEHNISFGSNNRKEIEATNEAIEGQINLFEYLNNLTKYHEESSGQLSFVKGVKEASFSIQDEQEKIQAEIKETNTAIEGQIDLFDYLNDVKKESAQIEAAKKAKEIGQVFGITNKNALKEIQDVILSFKQNSGELQTDENGFIIGDFGDELDMFANAGTSVKDVLDTISKHIKSSKDDVNAYSESWRQVREYISKSKLQISEGLKSEFGDNWQSMLSTIGRGNFSENGAKISEFLEEMNAQIGTTFDFSNEKNAWLELYEFLKHKPLQVDVENLPDSISEIVNQILDGTYKEETNRKYTAKNVKFKDAKFVRQNYELEQQEHAEIVEQSEKKQQKAHEETAKTAEEKANRVIASQDKVEEFLNRNTGKKLISTLDSDTVKSRTYQDEAGRTYTEGIRYNEKIVEWEDFNKELTNYTQLEKEAVKYTNQLALAYADLEKEQRKAKPDTLVLATLNQQIELLESRLEDVKAQAISYANETGLGKEYNYDLFEERVSRQTDEYAAKLAVKSAEQIRKENESNLKAIQKQDAFINKAKSSYAKKLSSINSSFSNLTEYKNVESLINNIANVDDINKIEVAFNKLEKVINDFKQNVKSTASLDPVFAAISKKGHLDNIVEKYQLEFEKLGLSVKDAKQKVKDFKEIADKIGNINLNDKDGMKRFGEELHKFNAEEDRLKSIIDITKQRNEIQKRTTQDATKSYKEKIQVIDKYAKAQDELNRLRGKEIKQGKDDEIIAEIKVKQKEVAILRENAIKASKALSAMNREGLITTDQKRIAQNLLKGTNQGGVDSSVILSGILDKQASKHGSEIGDITFKYQKLGLTSDETKQKLKDLLDAQKEVNNTSTGSVDERIQKELQYQEALKNAKNELIEFTRQEQLRLKEERANSAEEKATNKAYKDKYSIIEKYSSAQDKLNKLLGEQVKHGKSEELTAKIVNQTKEVVNLRKEAEDATKAIIQMWGSGNVEDADKEKALRLWNNIRLKKTDSFNTLNAIKADKTKETQYAGQTRAYEQLLSQVFQGQKIEDAVFKSASVDSSGKGTLTFLEIVGDKAREIKIVLDDVNTAIDEMQNGNFDIYSNKYSSGNWRKATKSDILGQDDFSASNNHIYNMIEAYEKLTSTEDKYQKLKAKVDIGTATDSQRAEFEVLTKQREKYNDTINKSIVLTEQEQKAYEAYGQYIKVLEALYKEKQVSSGATYDAYAGVNRIENVDDAFDEAAKINDALNYTKQLMSGLQNSNVDGYGAIFSDAEDKVKQLNNSLQSGKISTEQYFKEIDKIGYSLKNTIAVIEPHNVENAKTAIQQYVSSIDGASIKSFDEQTGKATITVERHGQVVREMSVAYHEANGQIEMTKNVTKETEGVFASFGRSLKKRFRGLLQYLITFASFYDIINKIRNGIAVIRDLDVALTEMRKVSDESVESLRNFQDVSFDIAGSIGTTAKQIQQSSAQFMRLGYSLEEASKLAEDANIYANVGDMEIAEATEHMVSSIKAWESEFSSEVEASEAIIDRYNEIGNNFAISSADIGRAMERSAAALKAGGNSLNESLGLITAGNIIQQDAETTANALKILSLRIRGSKTELEEMGEDTDGLASSTSKLREEVKALSGVDIMADENTYKSTAQIIQELGAVYEKMSDVSQAALLEKIAGKQNCLKNMETYFCGTHLNARIA